ncbi:MAG TPA: hypothetical protein VJ757_10755 [Pseudonocardiaceae bacterium]|jgi:hypothetical protein|nr:hypothetical protein [Pseudonocardiaceae bacterium]
MAEQPETQNLPEPPDAPVPNRRERRGRKPSAAVPRAGKDALPHGLAPVTPPRRYSTRRRSG